MPAEALGVAGLPGDGTAIVTADVVHDLPDAPGTVELYDLAADIGEPHNVVDKYPEMADELVASMKARGHRSPMSCSWDRSALRCVNSRHGAPTSPHLRK